MIKSVYNSCFKWLKTVPLLSLMWLLLSGCQFNCNDEVDEVIATGITSIPARHGIDHLSSPFVPLSLEEQQEDWSKELRMGNAFACEDDLYRAITCYKRALLLIPCENIERCTQISYDIMLCYYLGSKFQEMINFFETSCLAQADVKFAAFNNLLIMLYDAYMQTNQPDKANCVWLAISKYSPETAADLLVFESAQDGNLSMLHTQISQHKDAQELLANMALYDQCAKSPARARALNALLPGAGYYYVGQKRSAITSFIINALFTIAAYQFFHHGYPAAGLVTASLETGWYLGGINGAGLAAQEYNARLYDSVTTPMLMDHCFFPVLMFETGF